MSDLVPTRSSVSTVGTLAAQGWLEGKTARQLVRLQQQTIVRSAVVLADGIVQAEKVREVDHLVREAMTGQTLLVGWANQLAGNNPLLADELRFFTDVARLSKGEIIADAVSCMRGV
jgi:hypothetical protein